MHTILSNSPARTRLLRTAGAMIISGIFATSSLHAQSSVGLIGARYAEASLFYESINESGIDDGLGVLLRVNIPLHAAIDLTIAGSQEEIDTNSFRERTAYATLTTHWAAKDITPYLSASAGQIWQSVVVDEVKYSDDESVYAVTLGVEAPIADRTALDAHVSYNDYFSADLDSYWIYSIGLNHWFSEKLGATALVSFRDSDSTIFSLGAVLRF